jgi:hypothetical protein
VFKYLITILIFISISFCIYAQENHYHVICVDSLQVPYEYNSYKQAEDGTITFFQVTSTLQEIDFKKFTLSAELVFSSVDLIYTDPVDHTGFTDFSHIFNNDYFYIHYWQGNMCYVFHNDQFIKKLDQSSYYLPIDSNHIIYINSSIIYKINIETNELDSLSFGSNDGVGGLLPYNDQQFLAKHADIYNVNMLVMNNDLTIADTVTVNGDVSPDIMEQLVFNPNKAKAYQFPDHIVMTAMNYYLEGGTELLVFDRENQIVMGYSTIGLYHDFINLNPTSVFYLYNNNELGELLMLLLNANVTQEAIPLTPVPDRQFYNENGFIISLSLDYIHYTNQIGVSLLQDYPNNSYTPLTEQYFFWDMVINYWALPDSCFLIDFNAVTSHYMRKFRITGSTDNQDAIAIQNPILNCYPNPFNPNTVIHFKIQRASKIKLTVFNIRGQKIRQLMDEEVPSGQHEKAWDGKDDRGKSVSSGVYFSRLEAAGKTITHKMLLLK